MGSEKAYAESLLSLYQKSKCAAAMGISEYTKYQKDPVGFIRNELDITLTDDVAIMAESVRDNRVTLARSATGTGKSHGAAALSCWFYSAFPNSRVYTIAHPFENQKILWSELSTMAMGNPKLFSGNNHRSMHIERSDKDFITALSVPTTGTDGVKEGKFSGKHHEHMLFIVDEGDTSPSFVYRGIEGCMSGGRIVRLLILFNPRSESGEPYRRERDRTATVIHLSAFNHPNVLTGETIIPGAVDRETTVRRINQWCRPLLDDEKRDETETFELPDFLAGVVAKDRAGREFPPLAPGFYKIMEAAFSYMVLGQYPAQGSQQLISRAWVSDARARWDAYVATHGEKPPVGAAAIMGQDVAEYGDDSNVTCFRYGGYVEQLITWAGVDPLVTGDRAAVEMKKRDTMACHVDGTGLGSGTAPQMTREGCKNVYSVKVASSPTFEIELGRFKILRDQLLWSLREWLRTDPGAMLPPDETLIEEMLVPTYEVKDGYVRVMRKDVMRDLLKRSTDRMDALALTFAPFEGLLDPTDLADMPDKAA